MREENEKVRERVPAPEEPRIAVSVPGRAYPLTF
jgi:hypothetical protein